MIIDLGDIAQHELDDAEEYLHDMLDAYDGSEAALFYHMHRFIVEMCGELAEREH